jgi:type I restriction enzyme S subunit
VKTWNPLKETGEDEFTYIDLSAIDQERKQIVEARKVACAEAPSRARQLVESGDVLVSTVRPNLNGVARVGLEHNGATASTGFCVLRPRAEALDGNYAFQWVKSPSFVADMVGKATGASYPAVSDRIILESRIPLPPLPEQRRIAAILDQADALRAKRRETLAQLDSLTQSVFFEMFGDAAENPKRWPTIKLGEHTAKMGSGATPTGGDASYKASGISLIRSLNVRDGAFSYKDLAYIDDAQAAKLSNVAVCAGDVLLNITGASVARVCRAPIDVLPARVNQHVMIIRPK